MTPLGAIRAPTPSTKTVYSVPKWVFSFDFMSFPHEILLHVENYAPYRFEKSRIGVCIPLFPSVPQSFVGNSAFDEGFDELLEVFSAWPRTFPPPSVILPPGRRGTPPTTPPCKTIILIFVPPFRSSSGHLHTSNHIVWQRFQLFRFHILRFSACSVRSLRNSAIPVSVSAISVFFPPFSGRNLLRISPNGLFVVGSFRNYCNYCALCRVELYNSFAESFRQQNIRKSATCNFLDFIQFFVGFCWQYASTKQQECDPSE